MVMIKSLTQVVKYEKMKLENHFYEMLTATVSHEMRTPLNAVIALLSTIDHYIEDENGRHLLNIIENSAHLLLFLVNDMLDLFQIKNGRFTKSE